MPQSVDPLVGSTLAERYTISSRIARGGMACVYAAYDERLERTVAVKVMHESLRDDVEFSRKFQREARSAAKLTHPNVVAVFDQGCDHDRPYIVMEYVAGETLRRIISREAPLPPLEALELMDPMLSALAAAHDLNIIHRDVKPENVLVGSKAEVKVADFGLAKAVSGDTVTATQGLLMGTVSYIAPELVAEGQGDTYSDVYSAGIVLYEMLTGEKPHSGDTPIQVAYAHCQKDVPVPSERGPQNRVGVEAIPPFLDALVAHATARDPQARIQHARAFLQRVRKAKQALEAGITDDAQLTQAMAPAVSELRPGAAAVAIATTAAAPVPATTQTVTMTPSTPSTPRTPRTPVSGPGARGASPRASIRASKRVRATTRPPEVSPSSPINVDERTPTKWRLGDVPAEQPRRYRAFLVAIGALVALSVVVYGLWFMLDGQYTTAPAMEGKTRAEIGGIAKQAQLSVEFGEEFSERFPQGVVARTDPGAGTKVKVNSTVKVFMSKGAERFVMPNIVGQPKDQALAALQQASLAAGSVTEAFDDKVPAGSVVGTSQKPDTALKRDTRVDLVVSKGPQPLNVPDFTGKPAADAVKQLEAAGFTVKSSEEKSAGVKAGVIIKQTPSSGQGKKGDAITLVVSAGAEPVKLPDVKGQSEADAVKTLKAAGFEVAVRQTTAGGTPKVKSMEPAGPTAPEGSTVTIVMG